MDQNTMPIANAAKAQPNSLLENIRTFVYAGLIAIGLRTLAFEPFNIPSGSMIPTLQVGDFLFITKFTYGYSKYSIPFSPPIFPDRLLGRIPNRGDVVVFKYPRDNTTDYIKRVIGLPGDRIQMRDGQLLINGQVVPRQSMGNYVADDDGNQVEGTEYHEFLPDGPNHLLLKLTDEGWANNTQEYVVPPGRLFCMGDNRDNSQDSRFMNAVGFVPMENLLGKAQIIFFSVDMTQPVWEFWYWPSEIRWNRILKVIR
jgi:signal peptidase I